MQRGCNVLHAGFPSLDLLMAGEGLEILVQAHPAASLDQAPGGDGGLEVGPGLVRHLDGGERRGVPDSA